MKKLDFKFIPGIKLNEIFYKKTIKPILDTYYPDLKYSAALIGTGSDVMGYDDHLSVDHYWGPRLSLFLSKKDLKRFAKQIKDVLSQKLPYDIMGIPTNYENIGKYKVEVLKKIHHGPVNHLVSITSIESAFKRGLGYDPYKLTNLDWLSISQCKLVEATAGKVYYDGLKQLNNMRGKIAYYPHDVWLYILASQWFKMGVEQTYLSRTGTAGDEIGSSLVAAKLIRELMFLCFLMEKKYAPYEKWFGTAFSKLPIASAISPILRKILLAKTWRQRENYMNKAFEIVVRKHNELEITKPIILGAYFYRKGQFVINGDDVAFIIRERIKDKKLKNLYMLGSVDQFISSHDILTKPSLIRKFKKILNTPAI